MFAASVKYSQSLFIKGVCAGLLVRNAHVHSEEAKKSPVALSPKEFRSFKISKITDLSPNTKSFSVDLPTKNDETGLTPASFIMVKGPNDAEGKVVARPYTPTTSNDVKGHFDLVIKAYPGGIVSSYMHSLKVGDSVEVKGPLSKMAYSPNMKKSIGMVAGGTGITPMLQVILEILKNPADHTHVHLVFANDKEEDILLKATLDTLAAKHKNFKVTYILAKPSAAWKGHKGYVNADLLAGTMPKPSGDSLVLVCGPPGFMEAVSGGKTPDYKQGEVKGLLKAAGFSEDNVFKF